jgi:hypothetical protein
MPPQGYRWEDEKVKEIAWHNPLSVLYYRYDNEQTNLRPLER